MADATDDPFREVQKGGKSLLVHKYYQVGNILKTGKKIDPRSDLIIKEPDKGSANTDIGYDIPIHSNVNYAVRFEGNSKWYIYFGRNMRPMKGVAQIKEIY